MWLQQWYADWVAAEVQGGVSTPAVTTATKDVPQAPPSPAGEIATRSFYSTASLEAATTAQVAPAAAGRTGLADASSAPNSHGPVAAELFPRLSSILRPRVSIPHKVEAAKPLANTRRLLQIGLVLGMVYVAFLAFWFWTTRLRGHKAHGGARF